MISHLIVNAHAQSRQRWLLIVQLPQIGSDPPRNYIHITHTHIHMVRAAALDSLQKQMQHQLSGEAPATPSPKKPPLPRPNSKSAGMHSPGMPAKQGVPMLGQISTVGQHRCGWIHMC
eukprot:1137847-Pelagomonas_calceolata.AAC.4